MKKHLKTMTLVMFTALALSGCANPPQNQHQIITKSMLIVPPKPVPPSPEKASQRDVALYIIHLRGWGNAMATQLKAIDMLISRDK